MERKLIAAAVSSALALPMAAQAVEFSVSGHVNRAIVSEDDGSDNDDLKHVDSNGSETRFRFTGSEELASGMTAGIQLELGRPSDWRTRHANVYVSTAGGKITLGQASVATDGMAHARLGGPSWLGGVTNWCSYNAVTTHAACATHDGGRSEVLKYDSPTLGPATISVSTGNDEYWDAMLKIAGSFGDAGYDLRVGHIGEYSTDVAASAKLKPNGTIETTPASTKKKGDWTTASAAVAFGQGTSVAASLGKGNLDDSQHTYVELDHSYGDGSVGVYWRNGEKGKGTAKKEGSLWGVGVGHSFGGGATAYAGYRHIKEDGAKDNVDLIVAGLRVTFN